MKLSRVVCLFALAWSCFAPPVQAQKPSPAPLPPQLLTAKKIFIAYGGGPSDRAGYSGAETRTYDQFFAAMKTWGHYELVPSPSEADLVFNISFAKPLTGVSTSGGHGASVSSSSGYDPQFRLSILDVKSQFSLWTIIEYIDYALLQSNRDKNFDRAMVALVNDVARIAGTPPAIPAASNKKEEDGPTISN
jgi:hypothetical protein